MGKPTWGPFTVIQTGNVLKSADLLISSVDSEVQVSISIENITKKLDLLEEMEKMEEIYEINNMLDVELKKLKDFQLKEYRQIVPVMHLFQMNMSEIIQSNLDSSDINIDVKYWQIENTFKDVIMQLNHLTLEHDLLPNLENVIYILLNVTTVCM